MFSLLLLYRATLLFVNQNASVIASSAGSSFVGLQDSLADRATCYDHRRVPR